MSRTRLVALALALAFWLASTGCHRRYRIDVADLARARSRLESSEPVPARRGHDPVLLRREEVVNARTVVPRGRPLREDLDAPRDGEVDIAVYDPRKALAIAGGSVLGTSLLLGIPTIALARADEPRIDGLVTTLGIMCGGMAAVATGLLIAALARPSPEVAP